MPMNYYNSPSFENRNLLLIPCFNCATQISRLIQSLIPQQGSWDEIWFIDNGSDDSTIENIIQSLRTQKESKSKFKLLQNSENCGLGGTQKLALKAASEYNFTSITVLHGDDQAEVEDAVEALKTFKQNPNTFILGARFHKKSKLNGYSISRKAYNLIMNFLFSLRFKTRIYDLGSGLNIFPLSQLDKIELDVLPNDLTFNIELLKWLIKTKKKIHWFPISWNEVDQQSNVKVFSQTFQTIFLCLTNFGSTGARLDTRIYQKIIEIFHD